MSKGGICVKRFTGCAICALVLLAILPSFVFGSLYAMQDYSVPLSDNQSIAVSSLASRYLDEHGLSLFSGEGDFLDEMLGDALSYSAVIPTDRITLDYDSASSTLTVCAREHSHESASGCITFIPQSVLFQGMRYTFSDDAYTVSINGVAESDATDDVAVAYLASVRFDEGEMDTLLNLFYRTAKFAYDEEAYRDMREAYEGYLNDLREYRDKEARYAEYLALLSEYENQLSRYEGYKTELEKYENDYEKYLAYLASLAEYEAEYKEYGKYKDKVDLIANQLLALDILKQPMADGRDAYSAIFSDAVDKVVENKQLIVSSIVGVDEAVVDLAERATERVRAHLNAYFSSGGAKARYGYYTVNYTALCRDFKDLTASLDSLYRNKRVRGVLIAQGRLRKYCILLAQLALVTDVLNDGEVLDLDANPSFDENYRLEGVMRDDLLGGVYITDNDKARPITDGLPPYYEIPTPPEAVAEPERPQRVPMPTAPIAPEVPGPVPRPIAEPVPPQSDAAVLDAYSRLTNESRALLSELYSDGTLSPRIAEPYTLTLETSVTDSVGAPRVTVVFMSDGGQELYRATVRQGSACLYEGVLPTRESDGEYTYEFSGFEDSTGRAVSLSSVDADMTVYPSFTAKKRVFSVRWELGDFTEITYHEAGELPAPTTAPYKADDGSFCFVFSGYDREVQAVFSDTTYTAQFDKRYIVPTESGGGIITWGDESTALDVSASADSRYFIGALLDRISGQSALTVRGLDMKIELSYTDLIRMNELGVRYIAPITVALGSGAYSCRIGMLDADESAVPFADTILVSFKHNLSDSDRTVMYTESDGAREYLPFAEKSGLCSLRAKPNRTYVLACEYEISSYATDGVSIALSESTASLGDKILVSANTDTGYLLSSLTVTDAYGHALGIDKDGYITVGNSDVFISAVATPIYCTVSFFVNGKAVEAQRVRYGEMPVPPTVKDITEDGGRLVFSGWDKTVVPATESTVYNAVLTPATDSSSQTDDGASAAQSDTVIAIWILCAVATLAAVVIIVRMRRGG